MSAPTDAQQALTDLKRARAWALKHFNVGVERDALLSSFLTFEIDFEDDKMEVYPCSFGERSILSIFYRLKWIGGRVGWEGYGVLSGQPMCWLEVKDVPA